jgi:predicted DNA-binding transcriptional regulator AlpA
MPIVLDLQTFREGGFLTSEIDYSIGYNYKKMRYGDDADKDSAKIFHNRIWRVKDVANFLGCSTGHIYNLSSDERIPKVKKGKFLYFIPENILNWIQEGNYQ